MSSGWRILRRGDEHDFTILRIRENPSHALVLVSFHLAGIPSLAPERTR